MSLIKKTFDDLAKRCEKGLITYITGGDPDLKTSRSLINAIARAGADIIEIGIPFSDPLADGPVIQAASNRALAGGVTVSSILKMVGGARRDISKPIVLMTYYNPIFQYGLKAFCHQAKDNGVDGIIVPDLPYEESEALRSYADQCGIDLINMVAPTSYLSRVKAICSSGRGFIYCVSVTGVTGVRGHISTDLHAFSSLIRQCTDMPLAIGFGISGPEAAAFAAPFCDAVIVGSALVSLIAERKYEKVEELTAAIKIALAKSHGD